MEELLDLLRQVRETTPAIERVLSFLDQPTEAGLVQREGTTRTEKDTKISEANGLVQSQPTGISEPSRKASSAGVMHADVAPVTFSLSFIHA